MGKEGAPRTHGNHARALFSSHLLLIHSPCTSHAWPQATPQEMRGEERGGEERERRRGGEKREEKGGEEERGPRRRRGLRAAGGRSC